MFIDMHVHPEFFEPICGDPDVVSKRHESIGIFRNGIAALSHIENQMRCAGLDRLCIFGRDERSLGCGIPVGNEEIASLVQERSDLFIGMAGMDPLIDTAADELEYAFSELGLSGLKLNLSKLLCYPTDKRLDEIYRICIRHDKPIVFHSGLSWERGAIAKYSRPMEFEEVASEFPRLRICLAHFGWPWVAETAMLMLKYPNVYADTAFLYFDSADEFYRRVFTEDLSISWVERSLRHRIMFGSNNPRFEQIRMAQAMGRLGLDDDTLGLIMGGNALDFLGIHEGAGNGI